MKVAIDGLFKSNILGESRWQLDFPPTVCLSTQKALFSQKDHSWHARTLNYDRPTDLDLRTVVFHAVRIYVFFLCLRTPSTTFKTTMAPTCKLYEGTKHWNTMSSNDPPDHQLWAKADKGAAVEGTQKRNLSQESADDTEVLTRDSWLDSSRDSSRIFVTRDLTRVTDL